MSETPTQPQPQQVQVQDSTKKKEKKPATILSVDFDALLPSIGEMGRYQLGLYLLMCIPATLPAAFLAFNQVFLSAVPQHWCTVPTLVATDLTVEHIKRLSIPLRKRSSFVKRTRVIFVIGRQNFWYETFCTVNLVDFDLFYKTIRVSCIKWNSMKSS